MSSVRDDIRREEAEIARLKRRLAAVEGDGKGARGQSSTRRSSGGSAGRDRRSDALGVPHARRGESVMNSRPYSYARAMAVQAGKVSPELAKHELAISATIRKAMVNASGWRPADDNRGITCPLGAEFFESASEDGSRFNVDRQDLVTIKSMIDPNNLGDMDMDEVSYLSRKTGQDLTRRASNQSYLQQQLGGALVPYPEMGPVIPLLRNTNAVLTAGATVMPLPPSGRLSFPRQTGPTTGFAVGEGQAITASNVTTDQLTLQAKKIGTLLVYNNELLRYGGPIVEQLFRNDMTVTLGLTLDWYCLQGEGSDNIVAGLINYPGVTSYTPGVVGANGNQITPGDLYQMIAVIHANNAKFSGWIIRPELMATIVSKRASQLAPGDNLGVFIFNILRDFDQKRGERIWYLADKAVTETPQVPVNRAKGSATNLTTLYGGWWEDYVVAMYGTIEFATAEQGTPYFAQDQSQVRAILAADAGPRHPGSFIYADQLLLTQVGN